MSDDTVKQTKQFRQDLDGVLQRIKYACNTNNPHAMVPVRMSRERSLAITKIQEGIMWLGMDLKAQDEEGEKGCSNPYPASYDPSSSMIEPTADGLKL